MFIHGKLWASVEPQLLQVSFKARKHMGVVHHIYLVQLNHCQTPRVLPVGLDILVFY